MNRDSASGKKVDQFYYNFKDELGRGAFGVVYKGIDELTGQPVAVKVLDMNKIRRDQKLIECLQNEINIMKNLKNRNIVGLIDIKLTQNNQYIIEEFCKDGDLRGLMKQVKTIDEKTALCILKDLLNGFSEMISQGIVHRDLKPENILIQNGVYKIADFGFSRTVDNFQQQKLESILGTPIYMAPQILDGTSYNTKSDIWSLGVIYYEMLYGQTPWDARSQFELVSKIKTRPVPFPPSPYVSELSKDFILQCLKIYENQRISWYEMYNHPLFNDCFGMREKMINLDEQMVAILTKLTQRVKEKNIQLEDLFMRLDNDNSQSLQINEFSLLLKKIEPSLSREQTEYIFNYIDRDKDLSINFLEFQQLFIKYGKQQNKQQEQHQQNQQYQNTQQNNQQNNSQHNKINQQHHQQQDQQYKQQFDQPHHLQSPIRQNIITDQEKLNNRVNQLQLDEKIEDLFAKLILKVQTKNISIEKLFKKLDKDNNNSLQIQEFGKLLVCIDPQISNEEIKHMFSKIDQDNDNNINFQEFFELFNQYGYGEQNVQQNRPRRESMKILLYQLTQKVYEKNISIEKLFKKLDKDGNQQLQIDEFWQLTKCIDPNISIADSKYIFDLINTNSNDGINFQEFQSIFQRYKPIQ